MQIKSAHILGFSDGGNIALVFALKYPQRVRKLILNAANLYPTGVKASCMLPIMLKYPIAVKNSGKSEEARRHAELQAKGSKDSFEKVLSEIKKRDHQDSTRAIAPLKQAADAILVDTSELDIDGAVAAIRQIVLDKVGA